MIASVSTLPTKVTSGPGPAGKALSTQAASTPVISDEVSLHSGEVSDEVRISSLESDASRLDKLSLGAVSLTVAALGVVLASGGLGLPLMLAFGIGTFGAVSGAVGWSAGNYADDLRAEADAARKTSTHPDRSSTAPTTLTVL
jgi:hypothetical protein